MAANRFVTVSEEELQIMKESAVPESTKDDTKFGLKLFKETLPKPWPRMKPSPQRRAVSVHEDALLQHAALLDPEELKAALPRLQRSPIRKRANLGELEPCSEDLPEGEEAKTAAREHHRRQAEETDSTTANNGQPEESLGLIGEEETILERGESVSEQHTAQGESSDQRTETPSPERNVD